MSQVVTFMLMRTCAVKTIYLMHIVCYLVIAVKKTNLDMISESGKVYWHSVLSLFS